MNLEKVLPPGVSGKISGHLTVKVDEVFWTRSSPGEIFVELLWWGEKDSSLFRPEDITHHENGEKKGSSVIYNIRTSPGLFESYLRNCDKLTFTILRGKNKNVIVGSAIVPDILQIMTNKVYDSYFPILSLKGLRIGDIHISFELKLSHHVPKGKEDTQSKNPKNLRRKPLSSKSSSAISQDEKLLSDVLQKGNELRKAMMLSVLADCPIDKIDSVVNEKSSFNEVLKRKIKSKKEDPKLVDFLLGKNMTADDEKEAIETLRCISPDENLINLGKAVNETKVTKSGCCLHGKKCKTEEKTSKSTSTVPSRPDTNSSSSNDQPRLLKDGVQVTKKGGEQSAQKYFNCYRLLVRTLELTGDGSRKIYYAPVLSEIEEPTKSKLVYHPPGTSFILEISLPSKGPWPRTLKFTTKNYKDRSIIFNQSTTHRMCGTVSWPRVKMQVLGSTFTVYWRHLNQRVPCPLGSTKLDRMEHSKDSNSILLSLPLYSNTRLLTGHLNVSISLGKIESGGEAMLEINKNVDPPCSTSTDVPPVSSEALDLDRMSEFSIKPSVLITTAKENEPINIDSSDDEIQKELAGPTNLDDELIKTINLLNSKPGNADERSKTSERPIQMNHKGEHKREACVQTTLPLTNPSCPCQHSKDYAYSHQRHQIPEISTLKDDALKSVPSSGRWDFPSSSGPISYPKSIAPSSQADDIYRDYYHPHEKLYHDMDQQERLRVAPRIYNGTEKIHEYSVKIEKVVGVPLFTGDKDLDCYINYTFPKVDSNGVMTFDKSMGTEVRIALRETEFGSVLKHRLRLSCSLTRALLTLPSHEIVFSLWGRYYRSSPQDYRIAKAVIPLTKLSSLEMKYEQQRKRRPFIEKFVLPITPYESSITSGYRGPFGELHITISYSNASGLSYREWRCKCKDDHYWCRSHLCNNANNISYTEPNYECVRTQSSNKNAYDDPCSNHQFFDSVDKFPDMKSNEKCYQSGQNTENVGLINDYKNDLENQANSFRHRGGLENPTTLRDARYRVDDILPGFDHNGYLSKGMRQTNIYDLMVESHRHIAPKHDLNKDLPIDVQKENAFNGVYHVEQRLQPIGGSIDQSSSHRANTNLPSSEYLDSGKRENIVKKILKDIQERKLHKNSIQKLTLENKNETSNFGESNDDFSSFNLRVDLPNENDTSDFEVRSQYSFLKTPPENSSFPLNTNLVLESSSEMLFEKQSANPFDRLSYTSLKSNSSMFEPVKDYNIPESKLGSTKDKALGKIYTENIPSVNSKISSRMHRLNKEVHSRNFCNNAPEKNNSASSNATLKSVESLQSFKELEPLGSKRVVSAESTNDQNTIVPKDFKNNKYFKARIEICRALGLPSLEVKQSDGRITLVKPTSHAYFTAFVKGEETNLRTRTIEKSSNPVWDSSWEVGLPVELLRKSDQELEVFVDLSGDSEESVLRASDCSLNWPIVLRTGVDLTPLTAGLQSASGWYSLSDRALLSRAQIKVTVTPLEDISIHREEWLKEYTKSKGRRIDFPPAEKSSLAASLQEKLYELERLTQRMKNKMDARSGWDDSPPLSLLAEVQNKSIAPSLEGITNFSGERDIQENKYTDHPEPKEVSAIVISDDSDLDSESSGSDEVVNTYTLNKVCNVNSQDEDSLETSSQAIDRLITKVRGTR